MVLKSIKTTDFFDVNDIEVISWPAKYPVLNIIDNVWVQLEREVCNRERQFQSVVDLHNTVMVV